jgi:hypothetical protein
MAVLGQPRGDGSFTKEVLRSKRDEKKIDAEIDSVDQLVVEVESRIHRDDKQCGFR